MARKGSLSKYSNILDMLYVGDWYISSSVGNMLDVVVNNCQSLFMLIGAEKIHFNSL